MPCPPLPAPHGNFRRSSADCSFVRCSRAREALSSCYDGELPVRVPSRSALPAFTGAVLVGLVCLLLIAAPPATAHAFLKSSTPAADAVLATPPTSVELLFSE